MTEHQDVCGFISFAQGDYKGNRATFANQPQSLPFWFNVMLSLRTSHIFENVRYLHVKFERVNSWKDR